MDTQINFNHVVKKILFSIAKNEEINSVEFVSLVFNEVYTELAYNGKGFNVCEVSNSLQNHVVKFGEKWIKVFKSWELENLKNNQYLIDFRNDFINLHSEYISEVHGETPIKDFIASDLMDIDH